MNILCIAFIYFLKEAKCWKSSKYVQMDYFNAILFTDTAGSWKMY